MLLGNGNGTFNPRQTFARQRALVRVAVADVNGDGIPDLVVASLTRRERVAGQRQRHLPAAETFTAGSSPQSLAVADVNGDGIPDLVVDNYGSNNVSVFLGNGNGTFQTADDFRGRHAPYSIAVGDVNGDGRPDVVAKVAAGKISVLLNNGDGTFQSQATYTPSAHGSRWRSPT